QIGTQYSAACRGAILCEVMEHRIVRDITSEEGFKTVFVNPAQWESNRQENDGQPTRADVIAQLTKRILETYATAYRKLTDNLADRLTQLFFHHLVLAEENRKPPIKTLGTALSQEVAQPGSQLFEKMRQAEERWDGDANKLIADWKR